MRETPSEYLFKKAKRKVQKRKGFYIHFGIYVILVLFFFFMNIFTEPHELWFQFPSMAWGVGVAIHYLTTFGIPGTGAGSSDWEVEEIRREYDRLRDLFDVPEEEDVLEDDYLDLDERPSKPRPVQKRRKSRYNEDDMV